MTAIVQHFLTMLFGNSQFCSTQFMTVISTEETWGKIILTAPLPFISYQQT